MMKIPFPSTLSAIPLLVASGCIHGASDWAWYFEPYMLAPGIQGDAGIGRISNAKVDISFGDILDNLRMAGMFRFEGIKQDTWGFFVDYSFMDLGSGLKAPHGATLSSTFRQGVLEFGLLQRQSLSQGYLDFILGGRWWDNDLTIKVNPLLLPGSQRESRSVGWVDPFIGIGWSTPLNEKWRFTGHANIGGFGWVSDSSYSMDLGLFYSLRPGLSLDLRYKATWVDYEEGQKGHSGYFKLDTLSQGPIIGLAWQW